MTFFGGGYFSWRYFLTLLNEVAHFIAFGVQVFFIVLIWGNFNWYLLDDLQAIAVQSDYLLGIVCEQANSTYS